MNEESHRGTSKADAATRAAESGGPALPHRNPVIVVGAGPVGQTAALLLARWNIPSIVVDAKPARSPIGSKAICQQRDVLDIWEAVGCGAAIAEGGVTWSTARTFYKQHCIQTVHFKDSGQSPFPPWVNFSQSETEALLDAQIARAPAVDLRWNHRVVGLTEQDTGVSVRCQTPAGECDLSGSFVLACTGAADRTIHDAAGVTVDGNSYDDRFVICDIQADLPDWSHERRFYFDPIWNPGRQVLIHPCPNRTFRIDWQVPPDFDLENDLRSGRTNERIRAIIGDQAGSFRIVWSSSYRFHSRCVSRMRAGRILFAGDAAHLVSPFGARGLNSGVMDAENAAWKLAFVLRNWAPPALLDSYDAERRAAALENIDVTDRTMAFLVPQTTEQAVHRRSVLERAVKDPDAVADIDSGRFAEPFWYVDSPLTTVDPRRPFQGRPPKGQYPPPAPGTIVPDFPIAGIEGRHRLRQIVRDGLLAIVGNDVDPNPVAGTLAQAAEAVIDNHGLAKGRTLTPVRAQRAASLDPSGALERALGIGRTDVWLIRPDGHLAACLASDESTTLHRAVTQALGGNPH